MMTRSSSSARINIAASTRKLDVNNRIPLQFYYRIAENILKQAAIFRAEGNIIDLYIMLLRFSGLVTETIPCHRDYRKSLQNKSLKKKLVDAINELEEIKSNVQREIEELSRKHVHQRNTLGYQRQSNLMEPSVEWPPAKQQNMNGSMLTKTSSFVPRDYANQIPKVQPFPVTKSIDGKFRPTTLSFHRPNEETLNRHSIFGPNGLRGQWQPPASDKRVCYPSNIDSSPVEIPSKSSGHKPMENEFFIKMDEIKVGSQMPPLESVEPENKDCQITQVEEPGSLISFEAIESPLQTGITRQPSPPPVLADVQDLIPTTSPPVTDADCRLDNSSSDGLVCAEAPLELHISTTLMDSFMRMAKSNTDKNLETCGVLAGSLKNRKFCVTTLIIPKQESTSDSCQTTNEEEIFEVQDKKSLFPLGWIHTHPTQSCFMSSIDVHTHYSYQIMLPEAIAIVMAPRDGSRNHGIFRLTSGGMTVIRHCPRRGFHAHDPPADGNPIYKHCTDVYINPELKFDVIDLR